MAIKGSTVATDIAGARRNAPASATPSGSPERASRVAALEAEVAALRGQLKIAIRDLEISDEERQAIDEEAKSINEELSVLNKQLQETLERQQTTSNDLQNILDSSAVATLFLDSDLMIRFFTPAIRSMFRIIASDIGRPLADLASLMADKDMFVDAHSALAGGTPEGKEIRGQDGKWFIRRILPYRTLDGRIVGVVVTFSDISVIKAAKEVILTAHAYAQSFIDTIRQPFVVLDSDLRIVSANRSFYTVFQQEPVNVEGKPIGIGGIRWMDSKPLHAFFDRARGEAGAGEDIEVEVDVPGLGQRLLVLNARTIPMALDGHRRILVAIDDITVQRRTATALQIATAAADQANAGKSRFLAAASHDLRQPLQTIRLLEGLLTTRVVGQAGMDLLARLDDAVTAMTGMLNTLLDINQLEAGIVRAEMATFPVSDMLDRLRVEFGYHTAAKGLDWRVVPCGLLIRSDQRLLEQMLRNLLSNALKYTESGKVLLGCRRHRNTLSIQVWDTGTGIPHDQIAAIFDEFHQLDNPARERDKGLGLGLAIVQRLSSLLGHAVDVRSWLGKGSVFTIEIPLDDLAPAMETAASQEPLADRDDAGGTILIVEDNPVVRELLELLLAGAGYHTAVAADGVAARAMVASGTVRPTVIVADYNLPNGPNGVEVVREIQKSLNRPLPAIILTGDISTRTLQEIVGHGCVHLAKPVDPKVLLRLVQTFAGSHLPTEPTEPPEPNKPTEPDAVAPRAAPARSDAELPPIFVVDDVESVRDSVRDLLQDAGRRVEVYASCEAFLEAHPQDRSGCLIVDAFLPGMSGLDLLRRLQADGGGPSAIMITGNGDVPMAVQAMKAGALDFLEKPFNRAELLASVERVQERTAGATATSARHEAAAAVVRGLTDRQKQVLDMVLAGQPSKNIAADLGISQRTVENHRATIMHKTGSRSIPALLRLVMSAA